MKNAIYLGATILTIATLAFFGVQESRVIGAGHKPVATSTVLERLEGKTLAEKINIKSDAIILETKDGIFNESTYGLTVEIVAVEKIEGGLHVFAKAWRGTNPVGFGDDGTVEIERFRIKNPRIDVLDHYIYSTTSTETATGTHIVVKRERVTREDPAEALRREVAHTISVVGKDGANIIEGKIGSTHTTYYPEATGGSDTMDGGVCRDLNTGESWSTQQTHTDGNFSSDSTTVLNDGSCHGIGVSTRGNGNYRIVRVITIFDTSDLAPDTITGGTVSLFESFTSNAIPTGGLDHVFPTGATPASATTIGNADYDQVGSVADPEKWATEIDLGSITSGYNDWTLNATGTAAINGSGTTSIGWRLGDDNTADPTYASSKANYFDAYSADRNGAGTTEDPKLIVTHTSAEVVSLPVMKIYGGISFEQLNFR